MSTTDPDDSSNIRSIAVWWRALGCIPLGAIAGFVCAVVILYIRGPVMFQPGLTTDAALWPSVFYLALTKGATLGAIYLPFAYLLFLREEKLIPALFGASVGTVFFGLVGLRFVGPFAPLTFSASAGFWLSCFAIYINRGRMKDAGWQAYFK
jgi:hypothetical protein